MLAGFLPCFADEVSKSKSIEELLTVMKADKLADQVFDQMFKMVGSQLARLPMPEGEEGKRKQVAADIQAQMIDLIRKKLAWDKMKPVYVKIYGEAFTEEEIVAIVGFYKTPAGRSMLEKLPLVMAKSMELVQPMMQDIGPEVQRIIEDAAKKNGIKP